MSDRKVPIVDVVCVVALLVIGQGIAAAGDVAPSKIANIVERVARQCAQARFADPSTLSNDLVHVSAAGEIEVLVHAMDRITPAQEADLEVLGGRISDRLAAPLLDLPAIGVVQVWVPFDRLGEVAALDWVVAITPPGYPSANIGPTVSEGVALHGADTAQAQGVDGTGVIVGVSSVGAASVAQSQALGELPAVTVFNTFMGGPANDEGTAMLEIVSDMAPGATLMYDDGAGTAGIAHINALNNLVANGANVIAEDLAFDSEPAFQQGMIATAREAVAAMGTSVHSSSGNRGNDHAARVLAVGTGSGPDGVNFGATPPGCTFTPDNVVAIAPGGDTTFDVVLGLAGSGQTSITLQWSEPRAIFPTAGRGGFTDLNLYVMDAGLTRCLAESVGVQANGVGDTIEQIGIDMPGTTAKIVVDVQGTSTAVAAPMLDLRWRNMGANEIDATTRAGSIDPDKNYTGVAFSIGAVNTAGALVGFSSAGPVNLLQTTICPGGGVGPCNGVAGPAGQNFQGLDFLGANGVSVSGVGGFGGGTCPAVNPGDCSFSGTSASAPHTAACDALVRQIIGVAATPAQVRARLASTAIDLGPPGEDPTNGAGRLDCFEALGPPSALCMDVVVPTDPGECSAASASVDDGSFDPFDPNGAPSVSLSQTPAAPYALGDTAVELTAIDNDGLFKSCSATVTVVDQEPPSITCPADITVECTGDCGIDPADPQLGPFFTGASASDNCDPSPQISDDAPPFLGLGTTTVTFTATDDAGNMDDCTADVTVQDTIPPVIEVTLSSTSLWPPNHKLVAIHADVLVEDVCDPNAGFVLTSITSNEPDNGRGDGDTANDIQGADLGTADTDFLLRAERSGRGEGRVYTITYTASDKSGNQTPAVVMVDVPHDY
jgi:hypothetical protein